ncbi:peptide chain release factor N(5)-glutamine methyltransferase [Candidatus Desantisbacteria bacterium]|nr:peptide chain release factor N(5)-glutamine methyltransferase [Candidatus Desantisbacteria bacterium]
MNPKTWTVLELINETAQYFKKYNIDNPRLNIERILEDVLKLKRIELYLNFDRPIANAEIEIIRAMVRKRSQHIPLYYILGHAPFINWDFKVGPSVLIPRPETELLVERVKVLSEKINASYFNILDIGTGSGCIAICLAKLIANISVTAIDKSKEALIFAEENARLLEVENKIKFLCLDITSDININLQGAPFSIIVSNPPYIKHDELKTLAEEIKYEPQSALDGGTDGLDFYRIIIKKYTSYLAHGGYLVLEIGCDQGPLIQELIKEENNSISCEIYKDYQGLDRIVIAGY